MSINTRQQEKQTKAKQEKEPKKEHKNWYFNFIYKGKPIFLFNTKEVGSLILSIT